MSGLGSARASCDVCAVQRWVKYGLASLLLAEEVAGVGPCVRRYRWRGGIRLPLHLQGTRRMG